MAYLFIIRALPVTNSMFTANEAWLANTAVITTLYMLEQDWGFHYEGSQRIIYERIELLKLEKVE